MKISTNWVRDYVDYDGSTAELVDLLGNLGIGLEELTELGGDTCIDLEITSNRNDLNCMIGIAREIASITGSPLKVPQVTLKGSAQKVADLTQVENQSPDLCPRYTARVVSGVKIGPSPDWMQQRLEAVGLRPINNIVDITNYVLLEVCQPLHAFDYDKLNEGRIVVRRGLAGEVITSIDGTECKLTPEMLVIADASRPVAIAGVMGGLDTEVSDSTTTVLLESADFNGPNVRRTSRALVLPSESSYRFERGVDPEGVEWASRRAASLMEELAGGTTADDVIDIWPGKKERRRVSVRASEIERVLGTAVSGSRASDILQGLDLETMSADDCEVTVEIPSFRPDLEREIDLIEEIARVNGFNSIPTDSGLGIRTVERPPREDLEDLVHEALTANGFDEVLTVSFLPEKLAGCVSPWSSGPPIITRNPVRKDESALRRSLIPLLLQVKRTNEDRSHPSISVYEVSNVYLRDEPNGPSCEKRVLSFLHDGEFGVSKGVIETLAERLRVQAETTFVTCEAPFLAPGSAAVWKAGDRILAYLGTASEALVQEYDLRGTPSVAELDLDAVLEVMSFEKTFAELPKFPATDRDIAIVVDEGVTWEQVTQMVESMDLPHLGSIEFFDLYRGKGIDKGKKSIAFRLVFQAPDRTLTNEEVNGYRDSAAARLEEQLGAVRR